MLAFYLVDPAFTNSVLDQFCTSLILYPDSLKYTKKPGKGSYDNLGSHDLVHDISVDIRVGPFQPFVKYALASCIAMSPAPASPEVCQESCAQKGAELWQYDPDCQGCDASALQVTAECKEYCPLTAEKW